MSSELTEPTVELLQTLIRNRCVNDGTPNSGDETRNADVLQAYVEGPGVTIERWEPTPGRASFVARLAGTDPSAPSLCLMGHTDVVPVHEHGWSRDPFGGERVTNGDGVEEIWGRGAVDMLNLTSSMAVAFKDLATSGRRPRGDVIYFAVADEEAGSAHGARWVADNHPDAIRCDYLLTESGGLHDGPSDAPTVGVTVGEKGVAWRRLRVHGTPGHGSMPFGADNALITAAEVVRRLSTFRTRSNLDDLWHEQLAHAPLSDDLRAALSDPGRIDETLAAMPVSAARLLHACSHTTISPNVIHGGQKTNTIPDVIEIDVDIRTVPGDTQEVADGYLREAIGDLADRVEIQPLEGNSESTRSPVDTPLWDALRTRTQIAFPGAELTPGIIMGGTDARYYRQRGTVAYGAALFSPSVTFESFGSRFHGNDERIDVESLALTTDLWTGVAEHLLT